MGATQEKPTLDRRTTRVVQYETGKRYTSELTARDKAKVARRCLRDFEEAVEDGDTRRALDSLQDARSLVGEARQEMS